MSREPEEINDPDHETRLSRVAAIDVAKASGKVCTRLPHPTQPHRRTTLVWDVASTTNEICALAQRLITDQIERVVLESTGDYWRPFYYILEAHGVPVWLVNANDVKQVPGRPKTDLLTELADCCFGWCVRGGSVVARLAARDQRRGSPAGLAWVGCAAGRVA